VPFGHGAAVPDPGADDVRGPFLGKFRLVLYKNDVPANEPSASGQTKHDDRNGLSQDSEIDPVESMG